MPELQPFAVVCEGGLDKTSTPFSLLRAPGRAKTLTNMEPAISGGYKKIYGYSKFGINRVAGTAERVLGVKDYADGVICSSNVGMYFSKDGNTWIQINKDGASGGLNSTALAAASALPRSSIGKTQDVIYDAEEEYGIFISVNGISKAAWVKFTGSGGSRIYYYKELEASTGAPQSPKWAEIHKERLFLAGDSSYPNVVYWSDRYEMDDFNGAGAGWIDVGDTVTGIKTFRDNLVIFGTDSINILGNIDGELQLQPITRNIGCINGYTIQEFGGNILFLARDGIRTIAATDRIGDLELGIVSRNITPILTDMINSISNYDISSVVIKKRNQYRLYYSSPTATSKGIIGVQKIDQYGNPVWEWSEIEGWDCTSTTSSEADIYEEQIWHGDYNGYVYKEDTSGSFDGVAYRAIYETVDCDLGDISTRKTFHEIAISTNAEGQMELTILPSIDYGDNTIHQPEELTATTVYPSFVIGQSILGVAVIGAQKIPLVRVNIEGSGYTVAFKFETNDTNDPFTIGGYIVEFIPSGRR